MKFTIKRTDDGEYYPEVEIRANGKTYHTDVDDSLSNALGSVKRVEVSDTYFSGSSRLEMSDYYEGEGDKAIHYQDAKIYACNVWMRRLGLRGKKYVFIKVRK